MVIHLGITVFQRLGPLRRDVLVERAAKGHIDQLQTAADAKHRLARRHKGLHQCLLVQVADAVAAPTLLQGGLAIAAGPDIGAAVQHQAIEPLRVIVNMHLAAGCIACG